MLKTKLARLGAACVLAVGLGAAVAPSASAVIVDNLPAATGGPVYTNGSPSSTWWRDTPQEGHSLLSPYRDDKPLRCLDSAAHTSYCWQQRPDGKWVALANAYVVDVYPVWEDPASLLNLMPKNVAADPINQAVIRAIPAHLRFDAVYNALPIPVRNAIPQQVWDAWPR